jgi:amidohydrolase
MNFLEMASEIYEEMVELRRQIHQNPELAFKEFDTSRLIRDTLLELQISHEVVADTGVVALIGKGKHCVALRADIDALPILEETDLEYASLNPGVMHACGHDMHTAILLGVAKLLKSIEDKLGGTVKLIFQPAEEKLPGGAKIMIEKGVLENPKPQAIFGQHIYPEAKIGTLAVAAGPVMACADELYWTITGKSCHAAQPHMGGDPIIAAAHLISSLQTLISRKKDPFKTGVLSVTAINGGSATNIIPDEVKLMGTLRSFDPEWRKQVLEMIQKQTINICSAFGCRGFFEPALGFPPLFNHADTSEFIENEAIELFGQDKVEPFEAKMWAEDFAYYTEKIPGTFWFLGVLPEDKDEMPALHNSKIAPEESALINGCAMMAKVAYDFLKE